MFKIIAKKEIIPLQKRNKRRTLHRKHKERTARMRDYSGRKPDKNEPLIAALNFFCYGEKSRCFSGRAKSLLQPPRH